MSELPLPPFGKTGWPWDCKSSCIQNIGRSGGSFHRISIVTPSYNQGEFIEETIRSVLLQNYTDIEYIIIDGGSNDDTIRVIEKYSRWLSYWVSETDRGQSHAINKGFSKATGAIYGYINSDDLYEPGALSAIDEAFAGKPSAGLAAGICSIFDHEGEKRSFDPRWPGNLNHFVRTTFSSTFGQPASFWTADLYNRVGGFDESMSYCFDREFFLKAGLSGTFPIMIPVKIARFREHSQSKTVTQAVRFHEDSIRILHRYGTACGLPIEEQIKCEKVMLNEIAYLRTFSIWQEKGRRQAILSFLRMITSSPSLLFQRKVLGQMRRLLFFRSQNVKELR